ncbi:carbonyl reductase [NADPH] 1-like [Herpailurus yagouaroundi]|uniref:carbonyl reductase [NADPH] 1-like n=1 Tax=Herpailurus yagouaroundi TaxID=1608482 RepID=UPI001AD69313|nr:carbonyl reductase [NADPH] 1-like [Puma yagouaroundi]
MSSHIRVALVTGANKGIGFAIVRDLCRQFFGDVVLTARDEARGRAAVQRLQAEGLSPRFHLLDIDDLQSIRAMRDFLREEYGGLDVLVNNAGIAFDIDDHTPLHIKAELTMKTNFFGTRNVCTELLPLMKRQGRCDQGPKQCHFWNDLAPASLTLSKGPAPSRFSATPASLLCPHHTGALLLRTLYTCVQQRAVPSVLLAFHNWLFLLLHIFISNSPHKGLSCLCTPHRCTSLGIPSWTLSLPSAFL